MDVTPVRRHRAPHYPTRDILQAHPELLRLAPRRWRRQPVVMAGLALAGLLLVNARVMAADGESGGNPPQLTGTTAPLKSLFPQYQVAPIFEHGTGFGSYGCMTVNPPVFLSEEEARQVIIEEARLAGIPLTPVGPSVPSLLPPTFRQRIDMQAGKIPTQEAMPLQLDGADAGRRIAFEYVSLEDYREWGSLILGHGEQISTADEARTRDAAIALRTIIETAKPERKIGIFYDPVISESPRLQNINYMVRLQNGRHVSPAPLETVYVHAGIFRKLGGSVRYFFSENAIVIEMNDASLVLQTGETPLYMVDGKEAKLPHPVVLYDNFFYVPLRRVAELLGCTVHRDPTAKTVTITNPDSKQSLTSGLVEKQMPVEKSVTGVRLAFAEEPAGAQEEAREELRSQVREFLEWLRGQGVI